MGTLCSSGEWSSPSRERTIIVIEQRRAQVKEAGDAESTVLQWRFDSLRRAGYDEQSAHLLAARSDVELHEAVDLVGRGCSVETAVRILL